MITATQAATTSSLATSEIDPKNTVMGKEDFLNLLVTQLKNQDPLNPTDSTEFTAQLAQFSSLEMLENINSNIETANEGQTSIGNTQAVSYIGKTVYASGNGINKVEGKDAAVNFELASNASSVYVNIYDDGGNLIKNIKTGSLASGENQIVWDGTDNNEGKVEDGTYYFKVYAYDQNDAGINATTYMINDINGVSYKDNQPYLNSGDIAIPLASVFRVMEKISEESN
jgi:flagellar basal-body rod modification protein FlgD